MPITSKTYTMSILQLLKQLCEVGRSNILKWKIEKWFASGFSTYLKGRKKIKGNLLYIE